MSDRATTPVRRHGVHPGRLLFGLALAALGVLWLLDAVDVATIDWDIGLPIAVVAVGVGLILTGLLGRGSGGLVVLGAVLSVVLIASTWVDVPLSGGVGDRTYRPTKLAARTYELAVGKLTLDLRAAGGAGAAESRIAAHVGVGDLRVVVPGGLPCVDARARSGIGNVNVFGHEEGGFGAEYRPNAACAASPLVRLDLSVGIGQVEVVRG